MVKGWTKAGKNSWTKFKNKYSYEYLDQITIGIPNNPKYGKYSIYTKKPKMPMRLKRFDGRTNFKTKQETIKLVRKYMETH